MLHDLEKDLRISLGRRPSQGISSGSALLVLRPAEVSGCCRADGSQKARCQVSRVRSAASRAS